VVFFGLACLKRRCCTISLKQSKAKQKLIGKYEMEKSRKSTSTESKRCPSEGFAAEPEFQHLERERETQNQKKRNNSVSERSEPAR
jgi:hypothetical protein